MTLSPMGNNLCTFSPKANDCLDLWSFAQTSIAYKITGFIYTSQHWFSICIEIIDSFIMYINSSSNIACRCGIFSHRIYDRLPNSTLADFIALEHSTNTCLSQKLGPTTGVQFERDCRHRSVHGPGPPS